MKIPDKIKRVIRQSWLLNYYYSINNKYDHAYENFLLKHSPLLYAQHRYKNVYSKRANLKKPVTLDEKLLWLMLYWRHPLKTECGDKYTMRSYVQKHGYGHVLPELLGVYENSSEIDFDSLPDKFVLKCTHGCGFNIFSTNKKALDKSEIISKLNKWMAIDYSKTAGELHYASMKPRIICEPFLEDRVSNLPIDYKIYCFSGKAHCILVVKGRDFDGHNYTSDFYDISWNTKLSYHESDLTADRHTPKPETLDEMVNIAESLSKPFPFVRIDFYNIRGKTVLGEMTFTPGGCIHKGYTELGQNVLGSLVELPARII
jgi:hypothetical protein